MKGPSCTDHIRGLSVYSNELEPFLIYCHNRAKGSQPNDSYASGKRRIGVSTSACPLFRRRQQRLNRVTQPNTNDTGLMMIAKGTNVTMFAFSRTSSDPG